MRKNKGFTLAEILIAMTVLGIIVAASVPVILNMRPNKNAAMMKKAYYATETIISNLINDSTYYPETGSSSTEGFKNNSVTDMTVDGITLNGSHKLKCLFASKLNIKEDLSNVCSGTTTKVTTMDGILWDLTGLPEGSASGYLRIDVDGEGNGINKFYVASETSCLTKYTWTNADGTTTCNDGSEKTKKSFDRMLITISSTGKLNLDCNHQTELCNIISGQTKLFKGDND